MQSKLKKYFAFIGGAHKNWGTRKARARYFASAHGKGPSDSEGGTGCKTPANNCIKRGDIVLNAQDLKDLLSGTVRSTLNLTKITTDEIGSLKIHAITDREFIIIPSTGEGSIDRSRQNFSYPTETFKNLVARTHEVAGGYTSNKVALRKLPCNCESCRNHWGLPFKSLCTNIVSGDANILNCIRIHT